MLAAITNAALVMKHIIVTLYKKYIATKNHIAGVSAPLSLAELIFCRSGSGILSRMRKNTGMTNRYVKKVYLQ